MTASIVTAYRRDAFTWTSFGALFAFGYVNAVLGPALPYLRSVEDISYLAGALHQAAFAIGGGVAGLVSARDSLPVSRRAGIAVGLSGAGAAGLAVGYGDAAVVTISASLLMGCLATLALIRVWAALADAHRLRRAVAMSEGEVAVSLAGIATPLVIGALAGTAVTWRFAFVIGASVAAIAALGMLRVDVPVPTARARAQRPRGAVQPTLLVVVAIVALEFSLSFWLASYLDESVGITRNVAVTLVSLLYGANLVGRLIASRLARAWSAERVLAVSLGAVLAGLPPLLLATAAVPAIAGIAICGAGIGALFPLTSSIHVQATGGTADSALGEILAVAALGELAGPLLVGAIAQEATLRGGLLALLPTLALVATAGLAIHARRVQQLGSAP